IAIEFDRDAGTHDSAEVDVVAAHEGVAGDLGGAGGNVDLASGHDGDGVQRLSRTRFRGRSELGRSVTVDFGAVTGSARHPSVSGRRPSMYFALIASYGRSAVSSGSSRPIVTATVITESTSSRSLSKARTLR